MAKSALFRRRCRAGSTRGAQADSSERPLPRRAARMARPARVRIRRRKPWVLARRRLFGWKVRLLTRFLRYCTAIGGICAERWCRVPCEDCEKHGHAKTALNARLEPKYGSRRGLVKLGQTRVLYRGSTPPIRTKTSYGGAAGVMVSGDTPGELDVVSMNTVIAQRSHRVVPWSGFSGGKDTHARRPSRTLHRLCTVCGQTCGRTDIRCSGVGRPAGASAAGLTTGVEMNRS
jgi:hypothetical protein